MAGSSLLALIDDISTVLDDVALMTKVAAKKTAGVVGDDLALNAHQVAGVDADRELPVVWAVAKGSLRNKVILVPAALLISAFAPWLIQPLLMLGGAYLCFEGFEKLAHRWLHAATEDAAHHAELVAAIADPAVDMVAWERDKIAGAVRTDFILSAEIIVIALGSVKAAAFEIQVAAIVGIALVMTVGVYGLVAVIVKLDDAGLYLLRATGSGLAARGRRRAGALLLAFAPWLMKVLAVVGTAAMFMVGGGILLHGVPAAGAAVHAFEHALAGLPGGAVVAVAGAVLADLFAGMLAGAAVLGLVMLAQRVRTAAGRRG